MTDLNYEACAKQLLALRPQFVDMAQARHFQSTAQERAAKYPILGNGTSAKLGWQMQDYNAQGAAGNAAAASATQGQALLQDASAQFVQLLQEVAVTANQAGSAEQALVQIAVDTPRVVVSDVRLPGQDGLALGTPIEHVGFGVTDNNMNNSGRRHGTNTINVLPGASAADRRGNNIRTLVPADAEALAEQPTPPMG